MSNTTPPATDTRRVSPAAAALIKHAEAHGASAEQLENLIQKYAITTPPADNGSGPSLPPDKTPEQTYEYFRERFAGQVAESTAPRTKMECCGCGCFSSAQYCWHCSTNPLLIEVTRLRARVRELETERAALPRRLASALWETSALRHGLFTPPRFAAICEDVIARELARCPSPLTNC